MRFVMQKVLAAVLILAVAVGAYALVGGDSAEAKGPPHPPGCRPCKDKPYCGCTYNGAPRISCDPCCYDTYPLMTCLD